MKKNVSPLFLFLFLSQFAFGQDNQLFNEILDTYYKHNPFNQTFSSFVLELKNDPYIAVTHFIKKSEKNNFLLSGFFSIPRTDIINFIPDNTEILLSETPFLIDDSLNKYDTALLYQVTFSASANNEKESNFIKEYKRFKRRYKELFQMEQTVPIENENNITGEATAFYLQGSGVPSVSVIWGALNDKKQYLFTIRIYLKQSENFADLYY